MTPSTVAAGDTAWLLMSTALVMLMVHGLAFFYGGLVRTRAVLSRSASGSQRRISVGRIAWRQVWARQLQMGSVLTSQSYPRIASSSRSATAQGIAWMRVVPANHILFPSDRFIKMRHMVGCTACCNTNRLRSLLIDDCKLVAFISCVDSCFCALNW